MSNIKTYAIEIPLSKFIGMDKIDTLQDLQDYLFDNNVDYGQEFDITKEDINMATDHIVKRCDKLTSPKHDINSYNDDIKQAIEQAKRYAFEGSYAVEYINAFYQLLVKNIKRTVEDLNLPVEAIFVNNGLNTPFYALPQSPQTHDSIMEAVNIQLNLTQEQLSILQDEIGYEPIENLSGQELADDITYSNATPVIDMRGDMKFVDYYGTLGNTNDWFDEFQQYEEVSSQIIDDINKDNKNIDNKKYLNDEIVKLVNHLEATLLNYSTDEEYNQKLKRSLGSLKAIAKQAINIK